MAVAGHSIRSTDHHLLCWLPIASYCSAYVQNVPHRQSCECLSCPCTQGNLQHRHPSMSSTMCLQDTVTVGSKSNADLQVSSSNIAGEHAEIFQKGGRTYCRATAGDEEDMTSSSYTWHDSSESQLRTGDHLLYGSDCLDSFTGRYVCVTLLLQVM